jgi:23S rRNA pseudouridine955/2504/2580 synthase
LVHRLDKETSGLLVLARHRLAAARFAELLRSSLVQKTYHALVQPLANRPPLPLDGQLLQPIDGSSARTAFRRLKWSAPLHEAGVKSHAVWLELQPATGRKHQLRIHLARDLHAPIVGDPRYYNESHARRMFLHASRLQFPDPFRSGRSIAIDCPMEESTRSKRVQERRTAKPNPCTIPGPRGRESRTSPMRVAERFMRRTESWRGQK